MSIVRLLHLSRFHLSSATQHWLDDVAERKIQIDDRGRYREWIRTGGAEVLAVPLEYGWLVYGHVPATITSMTPRDGRSSIHRSWISVLAKERNFEIIIPNEAAAAST